MVNNNWYQDQNGTWKVSLKEVERQMKESESYNDPDCEIISVTYNQNTDNITIVTTKDLTYTVQSSAIPEFNLVPKFKLKELKLLSVPDNAIHLQSLDISILANRIINIFNKSQAKVG